AGRPPPGPVLAERQHGVRQVVATRDGIEHRRHFTWVFVQRRAVHGADGTRLASRGRFALIRNYDADVTDRVDVARNPVVSTAAGAAALAVGGAATTYGLVTRLPVVGPLVRRGAAALSAQGEQVIAHGLDPVRTLVTAIAVQMVEQILAELDLTT